jgi:glucose/arabinose dehydrogenase
VDDVWLNGRPTKGNLIAIIKNGVPDKGMPAWKSLLSTKQISHLADFVVAKKSAADVVEKAPDLKKFKLPKGFNISIYAEHVDAARALDVSPTGIVFVGSRQAGKVYALVDENKDGVAEKVITVAEGLNAPIGLTLLNGSLFVAEMTRVIRFDSIEKNYANRPAFSVVKDDFPKEEWHGKKIIKAGPDGKLYIPIGAPCDKCNRESGPHSKIYSMNPDGSDFKVYANGIRNTVGFAFHPVTKKLWFTDNGVDGLGDNAPSCELNYAPSPGLHFGFPYCHGGAVLDPEFGINKDCKDFEVPVAKLGPHIAPLGLNFYTGKRFPAEYKNNLFIAEHGSWHRSQKIGYRVNLITLDDNKLVSDTPFVDGFLQDDEIIGRPVDIAFLPDGSMLISDDYGGRIYRVNYH